MQTSETPTWWTPAIRDELEALYREVDREIRDTGVVCWTRGLCCDFEKVDHVLYATAIEIAYVREERPGPFPSGSVLCPFWTNGLCGFRERRPLGCRTYFCDERYRDRLEALHEKHLSRLRDLCRHQIRPGHRQCW